MTLMDFVRQFRPFIDLTIKSACPMPQHIDDNLRAFWVRTDFALMRAANDCGVREMNN